MHDTNMAAVSDGNDKLLEDVDYDLQRHLKGVNTRTPDLSTLAQKGDEKVKLRRLFVLINNAEHNKKIFM